MKQLENINLPNVTYKVIANDPHAYDDLPFSLNPDMVEWIKTLALKKPDLEFRAIDHSSQGVEGARYLVFRGIEVYEGGRLAGRLYANQRWLSRQRKHGVQYSIESHNISKQRGDRNTQNTADVKQATKIALACLKAKSDSEVFREKMRHSSDIAKRVFHQFGMYNMVANMTAHDKLKLLENMFDYIEATEDAFLDQMPPQIKHTYELHVKAKDKVRIVSSVGKYFAANKDITVFIEGGKWHVNDPNTQIPPETAVKTYEADSDKIPEHIRMKVGMLKLVDDRHVIQDVGLRIDASLYRVTPEIKEEANGTNA